MVTVNDILTYMNTLAPASMKMDWDNVGLLCGSYGQQVKKVLVALDPFESVCQEALQEGADLLVTHHPLIFKAPQAITDSNSVGRSILFLAKHGISAINAHTNLDCAQGGVNDTLARILGLARVTPIPCGETAGPGLLRQGEVPEQTMEKFLYRVKTLLGCEGLRYVNSKKPVRHVAVGGGACASEMLDALAAGCDTFVTADVKYNQFWDAHDLGLNLIDAGHFATENPVVSVLTEKIRKAFPDLQVKISETHADCMKFY